MNQISFSDAEYATKRKKTRREIFLGEMERVVPWLQLLEVIEPYYPKAGNGRRPYPLETMLRIHLLQNWFGYSDPAMEEALYEIVPLRRFAGLDISEAIPDETTILNFRRLIERHGLASCLFAAINAHLSCAGLFLRQGTIVDATIIHAPSSTKNREKARDPEMHSTKKGNQYYFGMKAHIGVDMDSGLVHHVSSTSAEVADVTHVVPLLHGEEEVVLGDAGYTGVEKREEHCGRETSWVVAARRSSIKKLPDGQMKALFRERERMVASVRAKVEHPFRVIKRQFGYCKTRFRGLFKNTVQLVTLFALSNLWQARKRLLALMGVVRPQIAQ
jgi:IS5 family transposase